MPPMWQERAPLILQIYRDRLKPGTEADYRAVEEDAARVCADFECPHPHLAMESLEGPKEVWWLNAYESEAEKQKVVDNYTSNRALMEALDRITRRKDGLTEAPVDTFANYRVDLSRGAPLQLAGARYIVVTVTRRDALLEGSVFEAPDGTRFILKPVATRDQADVLTAAAGPERRVFAVRPYWGMPAKEWIAADPEFWKLNPTASAR